MENQLALKYHKYTNKYWKLDTIKAEDVKAFGKFSVNTWAYSKQNKYTYNNWKFDTIFYLPKLI